MKFTNLILPTFFLFLFSCSDNKESVPYDEVPDGYVDLSALKVGQKSFYKQYKCDCDDLNNSFYYTETVISLEVIEEDGELFFKETLEAGVNKGTELSRYAVSSDGKIFTIPDRSTSFLFFFYADDKIQLEPDHDISLDQEDCRLTFSGDPFIGEEIAFVSDFKVGPIDQKRKTAVSCVPGFMNFDGYLIYDQKQLFMSHIIRDDFGESKVEGYVLTEEVIIN